MPAKKIPAKKPNGAIAPYIEKTRFFLGPGLYIVPSKAIDAGRNAAGPNPWKARQTSSIISLVENPAIIDQTTVQIIPPT